MSWKKEEKIIEGLALLYPDFLGGDGRIVYNYCPDEYFWKAAWVIRLCTDYLNQRVPTLEQYLRNHNHIMWFRYKDHFGIKE